MTGFDNMGVLNKSWGICGFSSSLYALYKYNPKMQSRLEKGAVSPTMLLAEIKSCLVMMKADGKTDLLKEIESFTRTFDGFKDFTIESYINRINSAVNVDEKTLRADPKFSMAMPPSGVVYYMQNICDLKNTKIIGEKDNVPEAVLGLTTKDADPKIYKGLKHWVYQSKGTIYSWGQQFSSIEKMGFSGIGWKLSV